MTRLSKIKHKVMYLWHTWRVRDQDTANVEIPTDDGPVQVSMSGAIYKVFIDVVLTLELDPRWSDEHIDALATFMITYPHDVDETTLRAFLHPEFYDMLSENNLEMELEEE